ncbi:protein BatD [Vibrio sp. JPW-9-11-11]|uniref:BatD family protein n=1 Tax=Vibrio sp. JPW-9-11-11 TaxID=1416532 RepID=UPI001592C3A5|nr:BatD family protein [Vibrio sp. JPW-9-11-11]NVD08416.1 protein BatD [Vibrio sp. JPW-9-11-11]
MVSIQSVTSHAVRLLAFALLMVSAQSWATTVVATVSKNKVVKNEVFQLRIVVDKRVSSDAIDLSALEQDFYIGKPSFGSSVNIINGDRSTRSEWNISLAAQRLGIAKIPAFVIDGAQSQPIAIQVTMDSDQPVLSDLIEVQSHLERTQLYPSESSVLATRLIIKTDPRRLQNPAIVPPKASGVSLTSIGEANQYQSVLDGVEVTIVDQKYRLTAEKAGTFEIRGIGFNGSIVYGDNRSGTTKLVSANTEPARLSLEVLPVPSQYQGQWLPASQLELSQQWRDSQGQPVATDAVYTTPVGESLSREITLDIQGLASERFPDLVLSAPSSLRVYQEKPQFSQLDNGLTRMTVKQVLIPQQSGEIRLDQVTLNWWDSVNNEQQTSILPGLTLQVMPAKEINQEVVLPAASPGRAAEIKTVYDAGFWPYLTALFALLWLTTVGLGYRMLRKNPHSRSQGPTHHQTDPSIEQALRNQDFVNANLLINRWLDANPDLAISTRDAIGQQIAQMNQSRYSQQAHEWQPDGLLKLLKHAQTCKTSSKQPPLAEL